jgi:hypothetical protein
VTDHDDIPFLCSSGRSISVRVRRRWYAKAGRQCVEQTADFPPDVDDDDKRAFVREKLLVADPSFDAEALIAGREAVDPDGVRVGCRMRRS